MVKRRFTFVEGSSSKFWEIEVSGNKFTTTWGKLGTSGQSVQKSFSSDEEAQKEAQKLINEKTRKGYVEEGATAQAPSSKHAKASKPSKSQFKEASVGSVVSSSDLPGALCAHFAYLADSPGFDEVLKAVMSNAKKAELKDGNLVVTFGDKQVLTATPAGNPKEYKAWPKSFKALVSKHEMLSFPDDSGWCIMLGDHGGFEKDGFEELEDMEEDVLSPICDYSDWYIYHPKEKNASNEPGLCYASHEGSGIDAPLDYNAGSLFLEKMARAMEIKVAIPKKASAAPACALSLTPIETNCIIGDKFKDKKGERAQTEYLLHDTSRKHIIAVHRVFGGPTYLSVYDCADPLNLVEKAHIELPEFPNAMFGSAQFQFVGKLLFIGYDAGWMRVDLSDIERPKVIDHFGVDWGRDTSLLIGDYVLIYYYLHDEYGIRQKDAPPERKKIPIGDGFAVQPLSGAPESIKIIPDDGDVVYDNVKDAKLIGERAFFVSQGHIHTVDVSEPSKPKLISNVTRDANEPRAIAIPEKNMLVIFEMNDEDKYAVSTIDIKSKPKTQSKIFKKHKALAWDLIGDELWLVLMGKGDKCYIARARIAPEGATEEAQAPIALDAGAANALKAMRVSGSKVALYFDDGTIKGYAIK